MIKEVLKYSRCFVCGEKNDSGLKARFYYDGKQAVTEVNASEQFEGYWGIYHGGIVSTLLDEVVRTGEKIRFVGWVTKSKGRVFLTEGTAMGEDGQVFATAIGKYIEADDGLKAALMNSVE